MGRPEDTLIGRTIGGKFEVLSHIGSGAMGQVFRARQLALDKVVALKVLHKDLAGDQVFAARFQREALAASRLDHPNSMRVIDFGAEADGMLYIAMEYLDGRDLHRVLYEDGPLPDFRIVDILSQALSALGVAHDLGVVHRDLKPENIMVLDAEGEEGARVDLVKVCDFGIAKLEGGTLAGARSELTRGPLTTQGLVVGTPEYMSPEQGKGDALDARSDLYSAGVVLFQMLTGRLPFLAETALGLVFKQVNDAPPHPSSINPDVNIVLESICLRALSKRPEDRFQSAREMRSALRAALGAESRATPAPITTPKPRDRVLERADTETMRLSQAGAPGRPAVSAVDRTTTGTATLMTVPVSQPNIWVLGGAALLVGAGLTAVGAMEWSYPRKAPVAAHDSTAEVAPDPAPSASVATSAAPSASAEKAVASASVAVHKAARPGAAASKARQPSSSPAQAPMLDTPTSGGGTPASAGPAFSLTSSAAIPTVVWATGVAGSDVRAALPSWKFTECYRSALQRGNKALDGRITFALTMDGNGAVTRVTVRGNGPLLSVTGDCMMDALSHVKVPNVAPSGATADVDVSCTPR